MVEAVVKEFSDVVSIYVAGSFARGDYMPGRSDVDIYVVLSRDSGAFEGIRRRAREIEEKYLSEVRDYHPEPLGVSMTTLEEIRSGRSWLGIGWEYRIFQRGEAALWPRYQGPNTKA